MIRVDENFTITVYACSCGSCEEVDMNMYFESEDPNIAEVDSEGIVTAINERTTRIKVSIDEGNFGTSFVNISVK